ERRGSGTTQSGSLDHQRTHHLEVGIDIASIAKWKSGADEAVAQMLPARDAHSMIVQKCAATTRRREEIVAHRIVDHALRDPTFVLQRYRYAILRQAVQEVCRSVQRIDDPEIFRCGVGVFGGAFLC